MSAASSMETRFGASIRMKAQALEAASPAAARPAAPGFWRDVSRDWCRWSKAERSTALVLLTALPLAPTLVLFAAHFA
jgi:hypothetical protein